MRTEADWRERRARLCLTPHSVNLNAGTCSPIARETLAALTAATLEQAEDPVQFVFRKAVLEQETTRQLLARTLACPPTSLLLFNNATYGVNTVARSLDLRRGDEIVLTDQEYHHYLTLWRRLAAETGARIVAVPLPLLPTSESEIAERITAALSPRTKVLFFSHVTSATGLVLPAGELCRIARAKGVLSFVDGAHSLGMIPVDLGAMKPDYYAANVHKWMMGPIGSAVLYVAPDRRTSTRPLITTGTYEYDFTLADQPVHPSSVAGPTHWVASHEYQGTRNHVPLVAAATAVRMHGEVPLEVVTARTQRLAGRCREILTKHGLAPASPAAPELSTCMVSALAPTPGGQRIDVVKALWKIREHHGFELAFPLLPDGRAALRVSNAWFNTDEELARLDELLARLDWSAFV